LIVHSTIGPLARGTSILDVAKAMVMAKHPYALLEGQPLTMIDAVQILRAIASANSVVDLAEVLSSDASQWSYEVPIVDEDEALKNIVIRDLGAIVLKGGNVVNTLYLLGKKLKELPDEAVKAYMDSRPKVIDPLITVREALLRSLAFGLEGYLFVGQKRVMGFATPIKFLEFFTRDEVLSMISKGDPGVMEKVVGDIIERLPNYYSLTSKLRDVALQMLDNQVEVVPIVDESKKMIGVVKARTMLGALL